MTDKQGNPMPPGVEDSFEYYFELSIIDKPLEERQRLRSERNAAICRCIERKEAMIAALNRKNEQD